MERRLTVPVVTSPLPTSVPWAVVHHRTAPSAHATVHAAATTQVLAYTLPLASFATSMAVCALTGWVAVALNDTVGVWACRRGPFQHICEVVRQREGHV